jgi:hypothetical protein
LSSAVCRNNRSFAADEEEKIQILLPSPGTPRINRCKAERQSAGAVRGRSSGERKKKKISRIRCHRSESRVSTGEETNGGRKASTTHEQQARPTDLTFTTLTGKEVLGQHERKKFMMPENIFQKISKTFRKRY